MFPVQFQRFGPSHLTVLALTLVVLVVMTLTRKRWAERLLAGALLATWPVSVLGHLAANDLAVGNGLPLHLCDVAAAAGAVALLWKRPLACEMVYFFGMAGTLQGLITPNLQDPFPSLRFFSFFLTHSSVVIAALYVVLGMRLVPRSWAAARMMGWILSYALAVGLINAMLGTNYGFLCEKPQSASLMNSLGPWPWYIVGMIGLATTFFAILDLPFIRSRRQENPVLSLPRRDA